MLIQGVPQRRKGLPYTCPLLLTQLLFVAELVQHVEHEKIRIRNGFDVVTTDLFAESLPRFKDRGRVRVGEQPGALVRLPFRRQVPEEDDMIQWVVHDG